MSEDFQHADITARMINMISLGELKTRDWKTRERIGYGKTIKPKQPTDLNSRRYLKMADCR